jgi:hypothetical protein
MVGIRGRKIDRVKAFNAASKYISIVFTKRSERLVSPVPSQFIPISPNPASLWIDISIVLVYTWLISMFDDEG